MIYFIRGCNYRVKRLGHLTVAKKGCDTDIFTVIKDTIISCVEKYKLCQTEKVTLVLLVKMVSIDISTRWLLDMGIGYFTIF